MTTHRYISEGNLFTNVYGKAQRVPEGHYYDVTQCILKKNTKQYERSKNVKNDYADLFSTASDAPADEYVEFELSDSDSNRRHIISCASKAFGLHYNAASGLFNSSKRIRCRADQFARFLIWRAEGVAVNQFQALRAKLVTDKPTPSFVDVRGN